MADAVKIEKRVLRLAIPTKEWAVVALALAREAKNLYNTCTFLIRQINSAYGFDPESRNYRLKDVLHEHQRDAITAFNRVIKTVNAKRKLKQNDKTRFITPLEPVMAISPLYVALDVTVTSQRRMSIMRGSSSTDDCQAQPLNRLSGLSLTYGKHHSRRNGTLPRTLGNTPVDRIFPASSPRMGISPWKCPMRQ